MKDRTKAILYYVIWAVALAFPAAIASLILDALQERRPSFFNPEVWLTIYAVGWTAALLCARHEDRMRAFFATRNPGLLAPVFICWSQAGTQCIFLSMSSGHHAIYDSVWSSLRLLHVIVACLLFLGGALFLVTFLIFPGRACGGRAGRVSRKP